MRNLFALAFVMSLLVSCTDSHFLKDKEYRDKVQQRFEQRKELAANRSEALFKVFEQPLSKAESEALQFLYAYMPLCDLADYNGDFFLMQVKLAFEAKEYFSWGKTIPEDIFRHFVLPYRVNNENLDSSRYVFYHELKDRIKGLTMREAALEVNHWCHEKVNYQPTDERTSAPLSTVRTSFGRCGEESTFTVTALRAVGIPARQVYTPRWAHCDDNHAWVEVWVDGKWYFIGACEPEPDLNIAWFTEPARRAMLVHTKVFGYYTGLDEVVAQTDNFTEINVIGNYAPVKKLHVKVVDKKGAAVGGAKLDFGLYNYAEFYPIASKITDQNGITSLTTGLGDLLLWASKEGEFGYQKVTVNKQDTVFISLGIIPETLSKEEFVFTPPIEQTPYAIDEQARQDNNRRLALEDSIRACYRAGFMDSLSVENLASQQSMDHARLLTVIKKSMGNWKEIKDFIIQANEAYKDYVLPMLEVISEKDLRDTKASILNEHLSFVCDRYHAENYPEDYFVKYVLNPRIKNENLKEYRFELFNAFSGLNKGNPVEVAAELQKWINAHINLLDVENYYNLPISPVGVLELKASNIESRNIFFVAVCRSLGIASRLEPASKVPQYHDGKRWLYVNFDKPAASQPDKGFLVWDNSKLKKDFDPAYYIHFTLQRLENGVFKTLDFGDGALLSSFPQKMELETGNYRLVTGMRASNGSVYTVLKYFTIAMGTSSFLEPEFTEPVVEQKVLAQLSDDLEFEQQGRGQIKLKEILAAKPLTLLVFAQPGKEPTKHLIESIRQSGNQFNQWNGSIAFCVKDIQALNQLKADLNNGFPSNYQLFLDPGLRMMDTIKSDIKIEGRVELPLVLLVNPDGQVLLISTGYKIGISEQILKIEA